MADIGRTEEKGVLPAAFQEEMKELFAKLPGVSEAELPAFLKSLRGERSFGLRRNPLKYEKTAFEKRMPFLLRGVPWAEEGYFYEEREQPGKSPFHEAGAYYIQEPSAMIVAEILGAEPEEKVADLCAAPGGKSTQIAGKMQGKGLLLCNEYVSSRAEVLAQNLERMGVMNCMILKEDTAKIAERFPLFFDRVLVDAPCSGEGMFRKEEQALLQWSPENVAMCAARQKEIMENAAKTVRPGGVLVYSTCTFSEAEDEGVIRYFLERHPEFRADETVLTKERLSAGVCPGGLPGTVRLWPHKLEGEGHFAARLIREGKTEGAGRKRYLPERKREKGKNSESEKLFLEFIRLYLQPDYEEMLRQRGTFFWKQERLFWIPVAFSSGEGVGCALPDMSGLCVERAGLFLGEAKKGRFEPSHRWAMTLKKEEVIQWKESDNPAGYLRGETECCTGQKGWVLMLLDGRPMGWGKASGNVIKNHYPKGLRKFLCIEGQRGNGE